MFISRNNYSLFVLCVCDCLCYSGMELKTPFQVEKGENSLHYTYLDTVGRPVIVAYKNNLVDQHIQDFEVVEICGCSNNFISKILF